MTTATTEKKASKKAAGAATRKGNGKKKPVPRAQNRAVQAEERAAKKAEEKAAKKAEKAAQAEGESIPASLAKEMAENAPVMTIELKAIAIDLAWNVRQSYEQIVELARDIQQVGLLTPLVVRPLDKKGKDGERYTLVAGFRRYHALTYLRAEAEKMQKATKADKAFAPPFTNVMVKVLDCTPLQAELINIRENISRNALELWDLGDKCKHLREAYGLTPRQVGDMLSYDRKTVNNAERVVSNVSAEILNQVRDPDLKVKPTQAILLEMSAMRTEDGSPDHAAQKVAWDEYLGRKAPSSEGGSSEGGDGEEGSSDAGLGGKMMSLKKAKKVVSGLETALKKAREEQPDKVDYIRGCLGAAKYLMGLNKSITGVRLGVIE